MFIGERLADLRKDKNLGQKELAAILGISEQRLSRYERDVSNPDDETKCKIAEYFKVSIDYLMGYSDDENIATAENVIVLPKGFPASLKPELKEYAKYLMSRTSNQ